MAQCVAQVVVVLHGNVQILIILLGEIQLQEHTSVVILMTVYLNNLLRQYL